MRSGRLEPAHARILQQLEGDRLTADYEPAAVYTREIASEALDNARTYGAEIRRILAAEGY